jgi:uncharacterized iron-regulated membrane protein
MNAIVDTIKVAPKKVMDLVIKHPMATILLLVIIALSIALLMKKENFDGMVEGLQLLAEYPATFAEKLVSGDVKGVSYENYFLPATEKVEPSSAPATQLELPSHEATVKVDIGNGLAVDAKVQVPAQTVAIPSQDPMVIPEAKMTDVTVAAQTVQIPAQTGAMPATVEGSDMSVIVPVSIPAQVVSIPEQKAVVPVIEPFSMM